MFQMATKHKLSSVFRNESLGLWYDAKSAVSNVISDFKTDLQQLKIQIEDQLVLEDVKPQKSRKERAFNGKLQQELSILHADFARFKQVSEKQVRHIAKLQQQLVDKDARVREEETKLRLLLDDLVLNFDKLQSFQDRVESQPT